MRAGRNAHKQTNKKNIITKLITQQRNWIGIGNQLEAFQCHEPNEEKCSPVVCCFGRLHSNAWTTALHSSYCLLETCTNFLKLLKTRGKQQKLMRKTISNTSRISSRKEASRAQPKAGTNCQPREWGPLAPLALFQNCPCTCSWVNPGKISRELTQPTHKFCDY